MSHYHASASASNDTSTASYLAVTRDKAEALEFLIGRMKMRAEDLMTAWSTNRNNRAAWEERDALTLAVQRIEGDKHPSDPNSWLRGAFELRIGGRFYVLSEHSGDWCFNETHTCFGNRIPVYPEN